MKPKSFELVGEPLPELNWQEYAGFLTHLEKAILYSLEKRKLLDRTQRDNCLADVEALHIREHTGHQA